MAASASKPGAWPTLLKEMACGYTCAAMKASAQFGAYEESGCALPCERRACKQVHKMARCERRRAAYAQEMLQQLRCLCPDLPSDALNHCQLRQLSFSCRRAGRRQTTLNGPPIAPDPTIGGGKMLAQSHANATN